jgi:heat shock protein HtpX
MSRHNLPSVGLAARMVGAMVMLAGVYAGLGVLLVLFGVPALLVVVVAVAVVLAQWFGTEALARRAAKARELRPDEDPELHALLDRLSVLTGLPKPRLAVSPDPAPNAFTVGRSQRHATIIVTRGLRERLTPVELDAVLAHELAHVAHRDVAVMTVASSLAIALAWVSRGIARVLKALGGNFAGGMAEVVILVGGAIAVAAVGAVSSIVAHLPLRALSRYRELAADRTAAVMLGQPGHVAAALVRAHGEQAAIPTRDLRAAAVPALGFVGTPSRFGPLFRTHPTLTTRLDELGRVQRSAF